MEFPAIALLSPRPDPVFDWFARKLGQLLSTPMALISLVDARQQVLPGAYGLDEPWNTERQMPLSHSFCQHVVRAGRPLIVPNAHDHPVVATSDAVTDLGVIAYAGVPLTVTGEPVGAACGIDHVPRHWTPQDLGQLDQIADRCSAVLTERADDLRRDT